MAIGACVQTLFAGRCEREGAGRYRLRLTPLEASRSESRGASELERLVAGWLRDTVRARPGGWCLFRPFFAPAESLPTAAPAHEAIA